MPFGSAIVLLPFSCVGRQETRTRETLGRSSLLKSFFPPSVSIGFNTAPYESESGWLHNGLFCRGYYSQAEAYL